MKCQIRVAIPKPNEREKHNMSKHETKRNSTEATETTRQDN